MMMRSETMTTMRITPLAIIPSGSYLPLQPEQLQPRQPHREEETKALTVYTLVCPPSASLFSILILVTSTPYRTRVLLVTGTPWESAP
jgi:hypothetical protein